MILAFRRPCADHRAALLDFVDRRALAPTTPAALAHLDRCRACERELATTVQAIAALRRLRLELSTAEPPADAWLRLRARVTRRPDPWRWRASLGGLVTSAMLVAVLVLPVTIGNPIVVDQARELAAVQRESAYLASTRAGTLPPLPRAAPVGSQGIPRTYPPEIANVRKEVTSAPPVVRPPEPI